MTTDSSSSIPATHFRSFSDSAEFALLRDSRPVHLGIGNYDGFHRGHRAIFQKAQEAALADGGIVGALTFSPHPEVFFRGNGAVKLIFSRERKDALFAGAGLDFVVHEPFSKDIADITAEEFIGFLRKRIPALRGLYVGDNFRFGAQRRGDVALLEKLGNAAGISVCVVPPVNYQGERISSTRIRAAIAGGEIAEANEMLARPYESEGIVVQGNRLGRTIGFPTLNLAWDPELRPRFGVYLVRVRVPATGKAFHGVANYGVRPTITSAATPEPLLETHLLDVLAGTAIPTYGDFICVEWLEFLRPETKFQSIGELKAQLEADSRKAEELFSNEQ